MTKAEEIAITECSGILYQDTLRAINLALEWAAQQCESLGDDYYAKGFANHIRAGKSE